MRPILLWCVLLGLAGPHAKALGPCARVLGKTVPPTTLPLPLDPVATMKTEHWTALGEENSRIPVAKLMSPAVTKDLRDAFNKIFSDRGFKVSDGRAPLGGLQSWTPRNAINVAGLKNPETIKAVDAWVAEVLRVAREATGEDLVVENVTMGRGHIVGSAERGTLIHSDRGGTYLHALVTLEGPTTLLFPKSPALDGQRLLSVDDATGVATIHRAQEGNADGETFTTNNVFRALPGETLLFGGADYASAKKGRTAEQHASPVDTDLNRLTLFVSFKPREK